MMNLSGKIRKLINILRDEDLDEIEVRTLFSSVRIARWRRAAGSAARDLPDTQAVILPKAGEDAGAEAAQVTAAAATDGGEQAGTGGVDLEEVLSPMVGTFYRAASPEAEPFISEGSRVETGQVLCIIEAMKLMNEIEAEKSGFIRKILVEDSQPVEYGQPLFLMESA
jgi:acetyl-CoA carboxylase biotin carboxyl carrier protein